MMVWCVVLDGGLVCSVRWWFCVQVTIDDLVIYICSDLELAFYCCRQVTL